MPSKKMKVKKKGAVPGLTARACLEIKAIKLAIHFLYKLTKATKMKYYSGIKAIKLCLIKTIKKHICMNASYRRRRAYRDSFPQLQRTMKRQRPS